MFQGGAASGDEDKTTVGINTGIDLRPSHDFQMPTFVNFFCTDKEHLEARGVSPIPRKMARGSPAWFGDPTSMDTPFPRSL